MVSASGSISLHGSSLQLLQPSAMVAGEKMAPKRLKIKFSKVSSESEVVSADFGRSSQDSSSFIEDANLNTSWNNCSDRVTERAHSQDLKARFSLNRGSVMTSTSDKEKRMTKKFKLQKNTGDFADREKIVSEKYMQISATHPNKRGPVMGLDSPKEKKQKIESGVMQQCAALLKKLMTHPLGWVFNQPVDPVVLGIPDYFTIISEPMDLGTIKFKIDKKLYMKTEEFAADVRLTFSNAMLYNPPTNNVHVMAKKLNAIFESGWKSLVAKWSTTCSKGDQQQKSPERPSKSISLRRDGLKPQASCPKVSNKIMLTPLQRQKKPKADPLEISESKVPPRLGDQSAEAAHTQYGSRRSSSQKDLHNGNGNSGKLVIGSVSSTSRTSSACMNGSCESMNSRSNHRNTFPSDAGPEQSLGGNNNSACRIRVRNLEIPATDTACRQTIKSGPNSDGGVSGGGEEKVALSSHPPAVGTDTNASASEEGWETNVYNGQLSPSKALRAAMLRSRFADTIVKAQEKTLLNNGERSDPMKLKEERERLEKQQREEKARIEAEIRAAEAASRARKEMELRQQRERQREAARIALQQMERTVEIYENMEILKDLEKLGGLNPQVHSDNPLERLGLYIRDEYLEDDELDHCNWDIDIKLTDEDEETENSNQEIQPVDNGVENCNGSGDEDVEEGEIPC